MKRIFACLASLTLMASMSHADIPNLATQEEPELDRLATNSPFGSKSEAPIIAAPTGNAGFEFRGVMAEPGGYLVSVYVTAAKRAVWVSLNESAGVFVARSYDPDRQVLDIEYQGQVISLPLTQAKIQTMAMVKTPSAPLPPASTTTAASPPARPTVSPSGAAPAVATTNETEAARLAGIVDEVRRRRAARPSQASGSSASAGGVSRNP